MPTYSERTYPILWQSTPELHDVQHELVAFSGDGSLIIVCFDKNNLRLLSPINGSCIGNPWTVHKIGMSAHVMVVDIALSFDGSFAMAASSDGHIRLWELTQGDRTARLLSRYRLGDGGGSLLQASLSPDARAIAAILTRKEIGRIVAVVHLDAGVDKCQFIGYREFRTEPGIEVWDGFFEALAFSHKTGVLAATVANRLLLVKLSDGSSSWQKGLSTSILKPPTPLRSRMCFSPSGADIASASGSLTVWQQSCDDNRHFAVVRSMLSPYHRPVQCSYSTDEKFLALSHGRQVEIYSAESLQPLFSTCIQSETQDVTAIFFDKLHLLLVVIDSVNRETLICYQFCVSALSNVIGPHKSCSENLSGVLEASKEPLGAGGFGEIYKGFWKDESCFIIKPPAVAIKVMRVFPVRAISNGSMERRLDREIAVWQMLKHDNILQFLGVSFDFGSRPAIVSEWMEYGKGKLQAHLHRNQRDNSGTAIEFLSQYPDADRMDVILGAAQGLKFLHVHNPTIVHGDMKAANILIDPRGRSRITDFGLSKVLDHDTFRHSTTSTVAGSVRWMAPELFEPNTEKVTAKSDVYAFAMTSLEIITGEVPFQNLYFNDAQIMMAVCVRDERPDRPTNRDVTDDVWSLWESCWARVRRPSMAEVVGSMVEIVAGHRPLRILSIDHSYQLLLSAIYYLREVERLLIPPKSLYQAFDLIGGMGMGGFLALLIGRLKFDADQCLCEVNMLYATLWRISIENSTRDMFSPATLKHEDVSLCIEQMLRRHQYEPSESVLNYDFSGPRIIAYASKTEILFPIRSYYHDSATPRPPALLESLIGCIQYNQTSPFNPNPLILSEVAEIFGSDRIRQCWLSCGYAAKGSSTEDLAVLGRKYKLWIETMASISLPSTSFFRFDFNQDLDKKNDTEGWEAIRDSTGNCKWEAFTVVKRLATKYMAQPRQIKSIKNCAKKLQNWTRPLKNGQSEVIPYL